MNISSVIVQINTLTLRPILEQISSLEGCEVPLFGEGKLIVTIEAPSIEVEVSTIKKIEMIEGVLSAQMVYSYSEDEIDTERQKIELANDFPDWLNEENIDTRDIPYSGNIKF